MRKKPVKKGNPPAAAKQERGSAKKKNNNLHTDSTTVGNTPIPVTGGDICEICGDPGAWAQGYDLVLCPTCRDVFGFARIRSKVRK